MSPDPASFRNRRWEISRPAPAEVQALRAAGADAIIAPILAARRLAPAELEDFLSPSLRRAMPDPSFFRDMDVAADRLVAAITGGDKIAIWSDYDVDGATSAATLGRFLRDCGRRDVEIYIPDRITEGYGPNAEGLLALKEAGIDLVCILDAGTVAFEPLEAAAVAGLDVVVVDHHAAEEGIPPAVAVVNPNRPDQDPGYGHLCAAGMTFILTVAANLRLRAAGFFDGRDGRPAAGPDLMGYLDLVALGTVCDVVPLTTLNRAFVAKGLPRLSDRTLPGIDALAGLAGAPADIDSGTCGFQLGPRINAGGRIGAAGTGAALLLEEDPDMAFRLAEDLDALNTERKEMERACTEDALAQLEGKFVPGETRALAVAVVEAHEGIVGISAARVKEALDVPAFVLAPTPEGTLKGSGRSVPGFDLGAAIIAARKAGLLIKGGGHAMAGGLTIAPDKVEPFTDFVNTRIGESPYAQTGVVSRVDGILPIARATPGLIEALAVLAPFGQGNPAPRFMLPGVCLAETRIVMDIHLKCLFQDPALGPAGKTVEATIWNADGSPFATRLREAEGQRLDILGALEVIHIAGRRRVQLALEDARPSAAPA